MEYVSWNIGAWIFERYHLTNLLGLRTLLKGYFFDNGLTLFLCFSFCHASFYSYIHWDMLTLIIFSNFVGYAVIHSYFFLYSETTIKFFYFIYNFCFGWNLSGFFFNSKIYPKVYRRKAHFLICSSFKWRLPILDYKVFAI